MPGVSKWGKSYCFRHLDMAQQLMDHGADIYAIDEEYRSTPLGLAARAGQKMLVEPPLLERRIRLAQCLFHNLSCPWIPRDRLGPGGFFYHAKPPNLNAILFCESLSHYIENDVDHAFGEIGSCSRRLGHQLGEIVFCNRLQESPYCLLYV